MKNLFSITFLFALLFSAQSFSQSDNYGLTAGYNNFIASVSVDQVPGSGSEGVSGYYIGFYSEFDLGSKFYIQPELQFSQVFNEGEAGEVLILPVMFKYYLVDKFNLQAGPVFDFLLDDESDDVSDFGLGFGFGGAYDINDDLSITTKYSLGLTNRTPDLTVSDGGIGTFTLNTTFDYFQIGLTYRL